MSIFSSLRTRIPLKICAGALLKKKWFLNLTQVLVSRNDGYGVQNIEKLMAVIKWNRYWLRCRTILVEWNPPHDTPLLSEIINGQFSDVACYVVTRELHTKIASPAGKPFLEYIAKNVGIRRAETKWIMTGNTDVIIGPDCLLHMRRLLHINNNMILRTRRVDIPWPGEYPSLLYVLDGRKYLRFRVIGSPDCSAPGDLTIASRELWRKARGYDETLIDKRVLCDVRGMFQLGAHGGQVTWIGTHFHFDHPESTSQGLTASHGEQFDPVAGIPYKNPENWGLADVIEKKIGDRIWMLYPG